MPQQPELKLAPAPPEPTEPAPESTPSVTVERLPRSMSPSVLAALLTTGVAAVTGLSVLTGHAMGLQPRASVIFALPVGMVVGYLLALVLILIPARTQRRHVRELSDRIARVAQLGRRGGFDELLHLESRHELEELARSVHEALSAAHADRLEAARLRREMDARVDQATRANTAQLAKLSSTDELTGLLNRRGFEATLSGMYSHMAEGGPELAVIAIDLDHFKRLNDTYGHDKGDIALKAAGELMRAGIRPGDVAARVGGDELFLLLRGVKAEQALRMASRLSDLYSRHHHSKGLAWPTMSVGIALARLHRARSPEHLLKMADTALYFGKRAGRSRCTLYDPAMNLTAAAA